MWFSDTYERVKHLEPFSAFGAELIDTKIAMALLKTEGKDVGEHFALKDFYEKESHE